jgi:hypothetical protein
MKNYKSICSIICIGILYIISIYFYKPYDALYHTDGGDAFGYYVYLPAFFIHHDLATLHTTMAAHYSHSHPWARADSSYQDKYFMGTAVLQAPFFLAAHIFAGFFHQARDGFSMIYMYAIQLSCVVYTLLGFFILIFVLRRKFPDTVIAVVLLVLGISTNLYYLVVYQAPFCHPYLFFWYSLLIYFTMRFYESFERRYIWLIGWVCGMVMLTRLNELYVCIVPLVWGINSKGDILKRIGLFKEYKWTIAGAIFITVICILPQSLYWKVSSGHFLYYSYQGEHFNFLHPHIWDGLFSDSNGWLIYSPVMTLSLVGMWFAARSRDAVFAPIVFFLPVHMYVIYSWWCWFYMGSYGSRPMTEAYALLSIPLAYSVEWLWASAIRRSVLIIICLFCSWLVLMQTYQSHLNIFSSELSNWRYNFITLGKTKLTYEESIVLDTKEFQPRDLVFDKSLGENKFDSSKTDSVETIIGQKAICLHQGEAHAGFEISLSAAGAKKGQWIKASINCLAKEPTNHPWHLASLIIACDRKGKSAKWRCLGMQNKIDNPRHVSIFTPRYHQI